VSGYERTLVLLKPDAVARCLVGRIIHRFESQNGPKPATTVTTLGSREAGARAGGRTRC
jgi:nucleoside diphosphate kinase